MPKLLYFGGSSISDDDDFDEDPHAEAEQRVEAEQREEQLLEGTYEELVNVQHSR